MITAPARIAGSILEEEDMRINWTGLAIVATGAAISASIVLPERARRDALHGLQRICWAQDVQQQAKDLAGSTMKDRFKTWMKEDDSRWTDDELDKITHIDLRDFYLVKVDFESTRVTCGASVDFSLSKPNGGGLRSSGNVLEFDVHASSPTSWTVTMASSGALSAAVDSLKPVVEYTPSTKQ